MTLQLTSKTGDFVHANQTMAAGQGFKCVSKLWYDKTKPISEGIEAIAADAKIRHDLRLPFSAVQFDVNAEGKVCVKLDGKEFNPTDHAFNQLASPTVTNIGTTIVKQLRTPMVYGKKVTQRDTVDAETLVSVFKNGQRRLKQDKVFVFRVDDNGVCRAVVTEDYAPINNTWYLETLQAFFKAMGGEEPRLSHWRGNADTVYGNLLITDSCINDKDSDYGGMLSLSNCEIGKRRLSQYPSIFRAICMNGCIWDQVKGDKISKVHRGEINLVQLRETIVENITKSLPMIPTIVAKFLATKDQVISKDIPLKNVFAMLALDNGFQVKQTEEVVKQYAQHEAGNLNMFGMVNAITRAGQVFDNETWVAFDELAGQIVTAKPGVWDNFLNRAKLLDSDKLEKAYGQAV